MKKKIQKALKDKDFAELFKKGGISFFIRIGGQVLGFLLTLIIANYFGAKGLGDYVLSIVVESHGASKFPVSQISGQLSIP